MSRKRKENEADDKQPSFEQSFAALQDCVRELESGQLTLDRSLECYEKAVAHLRACFAALEQAEQKIRLLVDVDEQGRATTRSFGHQASALDFPRDDSSLLGDGWEDTAKLDDEQWENERE